MRVLIFIENALSRNFGTPLELSTQHLRADDEVDIVVCRGALLACPSNSRHDELACRLCRSRLDSALSAPALRGARVHEIAFTQADLAFDTPTIPSIGELKRLSVDGENLGMEAASSVVTVLQDPRPNLSAEAKLVDNNLRTAVALQRWFLRMLPILAPDRIYVFNGRGSSQMPVIRVARRRGCEVVTYEIGHDADKYILVPGTYFHDLVRKKADVVKYWEAAPDAPARERIGHQFYRERRYGSGSRFQEAKYKDRQSRGLLPKDFALSARNVVIFNSSEFEFAAVEGYDNPIYANQMAGLDAILRDPRINPDIRLWLRVHPHLDGLRNSQTEAIKALDRSRIRVIGSDEPVDTYALIEASEKVLTFGSTVSIEAAYAGIPSILIGREAFESCGACYTPSTHDEVVDLINDPGLKPLSTVGALMFGHFMIARDIEYQIWDAVEKSLGGVPVRASAWIRLEARIRWAQPLSQLRWWLGGLARRHMARVRSFGARLTLR